MKPLTLSAHEVRAVLDGTKTQHWAVLNARGRHVLRGLYEAVGNNLVPIPKYAPGDQIWVREAFGFNHWEWEREPCPKERPATLEDQYLSYKATEDDSEIYQNLRYRPAQHMPRWASRITLDVTGVRVCRVQDVTEADAIATGIQQHGRFFGVHDAHWDDAELSAVAAYRRLWIARHGLASWDANDWCAVIDFERRW